MVSKCQNCGKEFEVLYPQQWVYQLRNGFFCTYSCIKAYENKEVQMRKITLEEKKKAVQIAIDGGDPRGFLKQCGSKNPDLMWGRIRAFLKEKDPEAFEKLPDRIPFKDRKAEQDADTAPKQKKADAGQAEPEDGLVPTEYKGKFGRWRRVDAGAETYVDFEPDENEFSDIISLTVEKWKQFDDEKARVFTKLGVEV